MFKKTFGSDNHSGVHPLMIEALIETNKSHSPSYGTDHVTQKLNKLVKSQFGDQAEPFILFNGTAANVLCIKSLIQSYHSVICTETSHLNMDECSAPENYVGCKLVTVKDYNGKLTAEQIENEIYRIGDQHFAQPGLVSITQPTEVGTLYSYEELKSISQTCKKHNLKLHVDGARFIYSPQGLNKTFKQLTQDIGVDALSFGGTKNGLLFGEMVILFDKDTAKTFKYIRKQAMQLPSKMRFLSQMFITLLDPDKALWQDIASHGHAMAKYLEEKISHVQEIKITQPVQANSLFVKIPKEWTKPLKEEAFFYVWDDKEWVMRWMMSFDTTKEEIDNFVAKIEDLRK